MIYKFLILSDEVDNFAREINIDSDATFLDLQNAILDSVSYTKDQMTSFFICDDNWEKKTEITLIDMDSSAEYDSYVMEDTRISEFVDDEGQKLLFVFDPMTDRCFFMELRDIQYRKDLDKAVCTRSEGNPPQQLMSFDDFEAANAASNDFAADLYGDDEYDISEIDPDGFSDLDSMESYKDEF